MNLFVIKLIMRENKRSIEDLMRSLLHSKLSNAILNELIWLCKHGMKKSKYTIGHLKAGITFCKLNSPI